MLLNFSMRYLILSTPCSWLAILQYVNVYLRPRLIERLTSWLRVPDDSYWHFCNKRASITFPSGLDLDFYLGLSHLC